MFVLFHTNTLKHLEVQSSTHKTTITHNNFRVSFSPLVRQPFSKQLYLLSQWEANERREFVRRSVIIRTLNTFWWDARNCGDDGLRTKEQRIVVICANSRIKMRGMILSSLVLCILLLFTLLPIFLYKLFFVNFVFSLLGSSLLTCAAFPVLS